MNFTNLIKISVTNQKSIARYISSNVLHQHNQFTPAALPFTLPAKRLIPFLENKCFTSRIPNIIEYSEEQPTNCTNSIAAVSKSKTTLCQKRNYSSITTGKKCRKHMQKRRYSLRDTILKILGKEKRKHDRKSPTVRKSCMMEDECTRKTKFDDKAICVSNKCRRTTMDGPPADMKPYVKPLPPPSPPPCKEPEVICPEPPDTCGSMSMPYYFKKVCVKSYCGHCLKYEMRRVPLPPPKNQKINPAYTEQKECSPCKKIDPCSSPCKLSSICQAGSGRDQYAQKISDKVLTFADLRKKEEPPAKQICPPPPLCIPRKKEPCLMTPKEDICAKPDPCAKTSPCSKIDPCSAPEPVCPCNKIDPCEMKSPCQKIDPCAMQSPCPKIDPCEKSPCQKIDPCAMQSPCQKNDPCAMQSQCQKIDPCKKEEKSPCEKIDPCAMQSPCQKIDPCAMQSPCQKIDPCKKEEKSPCEKIDPCAQKPCPKPPIVCQKPPQNHPRKQDDVCTEPPPPPATVDDACAKPRPSPCEQIDPCSKPTVDICAKPNVDVCAKPASSSCEKIDPCSKPEEDICQKPKDVCAKLATSPCENVDPCEKSDPCKKPPADDVCDKPKTDICEMPEKDVCAKSSPCAQAQPCPSPCEKKKKPSLMTGQKPPCERPKRMYLPKPKPIVCKPKRKPFVKLPFYCPKKAKQGPTFPKTEEESPCAKIDACNVKTCDPPKVETENKCDIKKDGSKDSNDPKPSTSGDGKKKNCSAVTTTKKVILCKPHSSFDIRFMSSYVGADRTKLTGPVYPYETEDISNQNLIRSKKKVIPTDSDKWLECITFGYYGLHRNHRKISDYYFGNLPPVEQKDPEIKNEHKDPFLQIEQKDPTVLEDKIDPSKTGNDIEDPKKNNLLIAKKRKGSGCDPKCPSVCNIPNPCQKKKKKKDPCKKEPKCKLVPVCDKPKIEQTIQKKVPVCKPKIPCEKKRSDPCPNKPPPKPCDSIGDICNPKPKPCMCLRIIPDCKKKDKDTCNKKCNSPCNTCNVQPEDCPLCKRFQVYEDPKPKRKPSICTQVKWSKRKKCKIPIEPSNCCKPAPYRDPICPKCPKPKRKDEKGPCMKPNIQPGALTRRKGSCTGASCKQRPCRKQKKKEPYVMSSSEKVKPVPEPNPCNEGLHPLNDLPLKPKTQSLAKISKTQLTKSKIPGAKYMLKAGENIFDNKKHTEWTAVSIKKGKISSSMCSQNPVRESPPEVGEGFNKAKHSVRTNRKLSTPRLDKSLPKIRKQKKGLTDGIQGLIKSIQDVITKGGKKTSGKVDFGLVGSTSKQTASCICLDGTNGNNGHNKNDDIQVLFNNLSKTEIIADSGDGQRNSKTSIFFCNK